MGAFTTRDGGVSAGPYDALDLALHVGDAADDVQHNRARLQEAVGGAVLVFAGQVHGRGVQVVDAPAGPGPVPGVDALVTAAAGLALVALAADCLPVLLADPVAGVVAAAHAGRPGLVAGVLQATVAAMQDLGARPAAVRAVIGPAVCGACYELPEALADEVGRQVPGSRTSTRLGTAAVDLRAGATGVLRSLGVGRISHVGGCTVEQPSRFYSYRRDGVTGRHAGVVRLLA